MWYVYVIENQKGKIYIGYSNNPERRLKYHNLEYGSDWTQGKGKWNLIYTEKFDTKNVAIRRERKLKSLKAGQRIKKILNIIDNPL